MPKALQCLTDIHKNSLAIIIDLSELTQALIASVTAELRQYLIGYLVLSQELGIVTTYLIPKLGTCFQQFFDIFPLLGIHPTQSIGPQVGVLVDRRLSGCDTRINKDCAVIGKPVGNAVRSLKEPGAKINKFRRGITTSYMT